MNAREQEKFDRISRDEKPGRFPFVRIDELRRNHALIDTPDGRDWDPRWNKGTVQDLALKYFPNKEGTLADHGALYGRFLRFMQQQGYKNLYALDFFDGTTEADRASLKGIHEVDYWSEPIPYPENFFDYATGWGFPEHLENPHFFAREVHRTLKPSGIFICSFPNVEALATRLVLLKTGELRNYEAHNNHIMPYFPGIFAKTFLRYFDIVEKTYMRPHLSLQPYGLFKLISRYLPNNKWFGDHTVMVLRKKPFVPYT